MSLYKVRDLIPGTPYAVVRFIGAGGMGSVYEVEDTSIGKRYVLKTLNVGGASRREASGLEQMMRREARVLAQFSHPHIVDVITAGKTADQFGSPFIVMEKLDGVTVRTMLQSLRFPRQSVWQISNELLDALYHLHHPENERPPMLHRDIKPENIFLAKKRDKKYVTKLLDLGIAVLLDGQAHGVHGTPAYMAPEQFGNEPLTEHTDLYQAACVIFEMLTGRHPYHGAKTISEWVDAHRFRAVPRVSHFVDVPKRVDDVLFAALSKEPSKRPCDAHAFMAGLHPLRGESLSVTPVVANTTVEDLHTAIEKRGESGYLAYATGASMLERVAQPGRGVPENALSAFAIASTAHLSRSPYGNRPHGTVPRHKGQTVPMGAPVGRVDAGRADMRRVDAGRAEMGRAEMGRADMRRVDAGRAEMGRADMRRVDAGHAEMGRVEMGRVDVGRAEMGRADMRRVDAGHAEMGRVEMGRADMGRVDVGRIEMVRADMERMDVGRVDVGRIDMGRADMSRIDMGHVEMGRIDRAAPTRSLREPAFWPVRGGGDTEHLLPTIGEERRSRRPFTSRDGELVAMSSSLVADTLPSPEPSNVARRSPPRIASTVAMVASALILGGGMLGASFILRSGEASSFAPGSRGAAAASATTDREPDRSSTATNADVSVLSVSNGPAASAVSAAPAPAPVPTASAASNAERGVATRPVQRGSASAPPKRSDVKPSKPAAPAPAPALEEPRVISKYQSLMIETRDGDPPSRGASTASPRPSTAPPQPSAAPARPSPSSSSSRPTHKFDDFLFRSF